MYSCFSWSVLFPLFILDSDELLSKEKGENLYTNKLDLGEEGDNSSPYSAFY